MKKSLLVIAVFLLALASAFPQATVRVFTSPKLPARDALERMNLVMAWNARVKVEGNRDGLFSVQLIPGKGNAQIVAQTYAGAVYLFDAENGDLIWKTHVGTRFWAPQPVGYNSQCIFATRRDVLHVINRFTGAQRVYTVDPATRLVQFGYPMGFTPSAAPTGDEDSLYVPFGDRVQTFDIPDFEEIARRKARQDKTKDPKEPPPESDTPSLDSPQPELYWAHRLAEGTTEFPLLVHGDEVGILTTAGTLFMVSRFEKGPRIEAMPFQTIGKVAAPATQFGPTAYIGSDDFNLYAVDLRAGDLVWRHVSGAPIRQKPEVNDTSVYIAPERTGLRRLDRNTGREAWTNRDASRFLASTHNIVYALDRVGNFFVLDGRRGATLAKYDLAHWNITVPNDTTDRIYLAANDGQILCLRNRDQPKPLIMKTEIAKKEPKKDEQKDEKKKEDDKDKKDDKEKAAVRIETRPIASKSPRLEAILDPVGAARLRDRRTWAGP